MVTTQPAVLEFDPGPRLAPLDVEGHSASLSPDGRYLAYADGPDAFLAGARARGGGLSLYDAQTGQSYPLQAPGDQAPYLVFGVAWLPSGDGLVINAFREPNLHIFLLSLAGDPPQPAGEFRPLADPSPNLIALGVSADGRYLAAADYQAGQTVLLVNDLTSNSRPLEIATFLGGVAWSPAGHQLAVSSPAGLYVIDAGTGATQRITAGDCRPAWYRLPE